MATITVDVPDDLKRLAETRASEEGFSNLSAFVARLILDETATAPAHLTIDSDEALNTLLASRVDGPFVEMDAADFQRIKDKFLVECGKVTS